MSVTFDGAGAAPTVGRPQVVFEDIDADGRYLAMTRDGQRILLARSVGTGETPLTVVTNWLGLLAGK